MKKTMLFCAAGLLALASCSSEEPIANNTDSRAIDFRAAMGTRGEVLTTETLDAIKVTAFYNNGVYFAGETFNKQTDGYYTSTVNHYWPGNDETADLTFYAYAPSTLENVEITNEAKKMTGFSQPDNFYDHADFITSLETENRIQGESNGVTLAFTHELSQIEIQVLDNNPDYKFEVSGVRIGKVNNLADYAFPTASEGHGVWTLSTGETRNYKIFEYTNDENNQPKWTEVKSGDAGASTSVMPDTQNGISGNVFLLPQKLEPWDRVTDYLSYLDSKPTKPVETISEEEDSETPGEEVNEATVKHNSNNGAYISLRLKITKINEDGSLGEQIYPFEYEDQKKNCTWSAIPLRTKKEDGTYDTQVTWDPGKKYVYILNFKDGAGFVDPDDPEPGKPILDPIKFSVSVTTWGDDIETIYDL